MIEDNQEYEEAATPADDSPTRQQSDDRSDIESDAHSEEGFDEQALVEILAEDQVIEDEFLLFDFEDDEGEESGKIKTIASNMAHRDTRTFGVFMCDLHDFATPFFIEFGNP